MSDSQFTSGDDPVDESPTVTVAVSKERRLKEL